MQPDHCQYQPDGTSDAVLADTTSVERYDTPDASEWNQAVSALGGSFYHLYEWRRVNETALGHQSLYLVARRSGTIVGLLPMALLKSMLFGRILCSMPFVNFGGPCAADEPAVLALMQAAMREAEHLHADYLELRCARRCETDLPAALHKVSMTIALNSDPEVLWDGFTHKHRKNVRRAYKNGLTVGSGGAELLPAFYAMMELSWRHLGTPLYAARYFADVLAALPQSTRIFICYDSSKRPVAAALTGYCNSVVEGLWAGGGQAARELDANYVLYWEMIRDACVRGCRSFHLGRSTAHSGGEDFKARWNAEPTQLYWYFYRRDGGPMPQLNINNPKYRLAIHAWRHIPLWCTRRLGPWLARSIP
jgi:FemAB-related protein (PEP-CTERM system-associated)